MPAPPHFRGADGGYSAARERATQAPKNPVHLQRLRRQQPQVAGQVPGLR